MAGTVWPVAPVGSSIEGGRRKTARQSAMLVATLAVGACVPSGHLAEEKAAAPHFDPIAFFAGHTEGRGTLAIIMRRRQPT